jgi:hypothetical protein
MTDFDKKIQEYYSSKALSEGKIIKIQRKLVPPRKLRILLYGPIGLIFFVVIIYKVTLNFINHDINADLQEKQKAAGAAVKAAPADTMTNLTVMVHDPQVLAYLKGNVFIEKLALIQGGPKAVPTLRMLPAQLNEVLFTYRSFLASSADLAGTLTVEFIIDRAGRATQVTLIGSAWNKDARALEKSIKDIIFHWQFVEPEARGARYQMVLRFTSSEK